MQDLISQYNNTFHRAIKMKPKDVNNKNVKKVLNNINDGKPQKSLKSAKFETGEKVRVSQNKLIFEKGNTPNWSTEIFTITKRLNTVPYTYLLKDYQDNPIKGCFYEEELSKTRVPDIYLVEKVLKRQGNNIYVKWLGFDKNHNSWIHKNDL